MKIYLILTVIVLSAFGDRNTNIPVKTSQATIHKIGERYGGGVVFYVDSTGNHGLIAATADQKKVKWYNGNYVVTNATGAAVGTGQANTRTIVSAQGAGSYAASVCDQLELNGYSDWFLPSKEELNLLRSQKTAVGGFANPFYWSSTEYSSHYAWAQNFNNGRQDYGNKNSTPSIRAVRAF